MISACKMSYSANNIGSISAQSRLDLACKMSYPANAPRYILSVVSDSLSIASYDAARLDRTISFHPVGSDCAEERPAMMSAPTPVVETSSNILFIFYLFM